MELKQDSGRCTGQTVMEIFASQTRSQENWDKLELITMTDNDDTKAASIETIPPIRNMVYFFCT